LVPVAVYFVIISLLSGLALVSGRGSPPPLLGMAWGILLVGIGVGAYKLERVSPRSILPSSRSLFPVLGAVGAFWLLYNLIIYALALGSIPGFATTSSQVVAHPVLYFAAFGSSLLFTALPEEFVFRGYLQSKLIAESGGTDLRAAATGTGTAAVLFALFHLPRWFLMSGHGVSPALAARLSVLVMSGLAFGLVYELTDNLWLVTLFHTTMNQPPLLFTVNIPSELHFVVGGIEYTTLIVFTVLVLYFINSDVISAVQLQGTEIPPSDD
jgi:membrane protease YdiL (CAAX protease family)